jgi:AraC family transcriptional regulator
MVFRSRSICARFDMNDETAWALYENCLRRVSTHIHDHLDEELDMDKLAGIACMSS